MGQFQFTKVSGWWFLFCRLKLTASFSKPLLGSHFIKKGDNTHNIGAPSQSGGPSPGPSHQSAVIWDTVDVRSAPYNIHNCGASSQSEGSLPGPSHQPAVIQDTVGIGSAPELSTSLFLQHSQSVAHSWIMAKYESALKYGSTSSPSDSMPDKAIGPWEFTAWQNILSVKQPYLPHQQAMNEARFAALKRLLKEKDSDYCVSVSFMFVHHPSNSCYFSAHSWGTDVP